MSDSDTPKQNNIEQTVNDTKYAATSATGSATVYVYNYNYYKEDVRVTPVKSDEVANDDNLPCPYRGLLHFSPNDAEFFFGREVFVEELFAATQTCNFIPVLGASGSGKSSVVLAGLVPKLQNEGHWLFTHFRPNSDPFHALALALVPLYNLNLDKTDQIIQARKLSKALGEGEIPLADVFAQIHQNHPTHQVLLIADQFEEVYTLCTDQKIRHSFLDTLLASFPSCPSQSHYKRILVATMRADFLGNALLYPPFGDLLKTDIKLIRSMNYEELEQIIVKPPEKLGVTFQEGLVKRILDDVESEPGNLPLLEFALAELWKLRKGKQLTHAAYEDIGEVKGALAQDANKKYGKFTPAEQKQVQRIFIQLVCPNEEIKDTRRLATKTELGEENWFLVSKLAGERLVVTNRNSTGQETVEVTHEALIQHWSLLQEWMKTNREFRYWQESLRAAIRQWETSNKHKDTLLRGLPLAKAEDWLKKRKEELSKGEEQFIQQSLALRRRKAQIRIILISSGFVFILIIIAAIGFVRDQWYQTKILDVQAKLFEVIQEGLFKVEQPDTIKVLLKSLPDYLRKGEESYEIGNIEQALAVYRKIIIVTNEIRNKHIANPQKIQISKTDLEQLNKISNSASNFLESIILNEQLPKIETYLRTKQIGRLKTEEEFIQLRRDDNPNYRSINPNTDSFLDLDYENKYTEGALKKTYEILMRSFGVAADLNQNDALDQKEVKQIPCSILKKIENIWRKWTKNKCGWYGSIDENSAPECKELEEKTLTLSIFGHSSENAVRRLNQCQIISEEINNKF